MSVTMDFKYGVIVLLALCALASKGQAQECVAQSVVNMTLTAHHLLTWAVSEDEVCDVHQFLVYIYEQDRPIEYSFEVAEPWVDVSFLEVCHEWIFVVVPISEHTRGREHRLFGSIPLPADADLDIEYINITRNGVTGDLHLSWDLADRRYGSCSLRYRLTIEEDGDEEIHDLYLSERSVNLHFLSPCTSYQFGVRAINIAHPTIEGPIRTEFGTIPGAVQISPHLDNLDLGVFGFKMTWELESVVRNKCAVKELLINGGDFFQKIVHLEDDGIRGPIEVEIDNLKENSLYYFRAYVLNSAGWSAPTVVAVHTLNVEPDNKV
ncbi:uncharacterized protein LOC108910449 isoform X2 [Anoplophora glabripennis]|uniref:uncharacterized protein LOC108910449 isoform X2 n=1 Tax=Anoplophora glabripennis TaxID=217634 RepID=UPI000874EE58|nr:uncharacterized protein LOC108910449 isoform X2 [Anoplophora glabripennis]